MDSRLPRSDAEDSHMLKQNFDSHEHENNAAENFSFGLVSRAEYVAYLDADSRKTKGNHTDSGGGNPDIDALNGKGNADGKRINTVETASGSIARGPKEAVISSSFFRDSQIMLSPMSTSRAKAIQ